MKFMVSFVEVVKRNYFDFEVLPRCWVVERTFDWLERYRRARSDSQMLPEVSEAIVYAAMDKLMLNRFVC
ncbi:hypothetical protein CEN49_04750 [Fischerella thermalis CCMEE 5273]|uniref:Transposase DDE domain-containing protein n=1 Tax=Chlorogloeopsis fritschii PCC 6912 TaxID=211165 RepID=A0A3S1FQD7_CHLFR|nr:hypothetical protein CEN49_04750 [Fischerella thermalis CCMEE 5273]PMB49954.1 hypothetical protein CEN40_03230 [Fischerella thermalis CCMEE 5205]RUR83662.1 hypothetical protein PCC6912_19050 [Chlorogloeopsis fritschii PCC 6912]